MDNTPELWAFVLANTGIFIASSILAGLSFLAYRQQRHVWTFKLAGIGFLFVLLGGFVEPAYQLGARGDPYLDGTELLWLQTGEGILITIGLGILFYAIITHHPASRTKPDDERVFDQELHQADYFLSDD